MTRYAETTTISADRSIAEISKMLTARYGADAKAVIEEPSQIGVQFRLPKYSRTVRVTLPLPSLQSFAISPGRIRRTGRQMQNAYDKEVARLWRVIVLLIKGKMELVESGIPFDREWLGYLALPTGQTMGDLTSDKLTDALEQGPGLMLQRMEQAALPERSE